MCWVVSRGEGSAGWTQGRTRNATTVPFPRYERFLLLQSRRAGQFLLWNPDHLSLHLYLRKMECFFLVFTTWFEHLGTAKQLHKGILKLTPPSLKGAFTFVSKIVHFLILTCHQLKDTFNPLSKSIKNTSHKSKFHKMACYTLLWYQNRFLSPLPLLGDSRSLKLHQSL